jgi:hypothetical protein
MSRKFVTISGVLDTILAKPSQATFDSSALMRCHFQAKRRGPNFDRWLVLGSTTIGLVDNHLSFIIGEHEKRGLPIKILSLEGTGKQANSRFDNGRFDPTLGWLYKLVLEADAEVIESINLGEIEGVPGIYKIRIDPSRKGSQAEMPHNLTMKASGEPLFFEYVGQSRNVAKRRDQHVKAMLEGNHSNNGLWQLWNQFGEDVFIFSMLEKAPSELHGVELALWLGASEYLHVYDSKSNKSVVNINIAEPELVFSEDEEKLFEKVIESYLEDGAKNEHVAHGRIPFLDLLALKKKLQASQVNLSEKEAIHHQLILEKKKNDGWLIRPFISQNRIDSIDRSFNEVESVIKTLRGEISRYAALLESHDRAVRRLKGHEYVIKYYLDQKGLGVGRQSNAGAGVGSRRYIN